MSAQQDPGIGIPVPEYGVTIPWRITQSELYELIPRDRFESCAHGPTMLRFTLFGHAAPYWFNFVSRPWLSEVQFCRRQPCWRAIKPRYRASADALRRALGPTHRTEYRDGQQVWDFADVRVENAVSQSWRPTQRSGKRYLHILSVRLRSNTQR
ncbi:MULTISPECIES: hypothetical protein [unclassified Lysobacter]|uniref:hypothetical protein n=1 Tax=unclassified Lysobacter TaxID=2635362 RepID=UPI001BE7D567|nr:MULTISPECIES: hypothetical protein [unclassified Lysobacter]MBT2746873.1 hypothetical protein [Lysobacter sp. ISL-42]MBT2753622.1 hypothetical protein [Lysobacter sp. ISL-50]MBT2779762.1 hypothetical protein [Lysobacter sp. ISL-54]MBT2784370.1 hypothetical protein [Lysobacter sp. ISL-52]